MSLRLLLLSQEPTTASFSGTGWHTLVWRSLRKVFFPETITQQSVRLVERRSIRVFVESQRSYLKGRVLDFGAGQQPYKDIVEGEYVPHEKGEVFPAGIFDATLMNQVAQYLPDPAETFHKLALVSRYLVMTYPTNWYEVEDADLWRYTKSGMEKILIDAGFEVITHEPRCAIDFCDFRLTLGYGVVAKSSKCK